MIAMPFHPSNTYTIDELNENLYDILSDVEKKAQVRDVYKRQEELPAPRKASVVKEKADPAFQEEMVEKITASIRQTAATGSHFSKMLSPEEEAVSYTHLHPPASG